MPNLLKQQTIIYRSEIRITVRLFLFVIISLLNSGSLFAQTNGWYTATSIGNKSWVIKEPGFAENMYLLEGKDSALLIDAGFGMGNLRDFVKLLSTKPLMLVNTHFHPDHTGGDYQFPKIYIGAGDEGYAAPFLDPKLMQGITSTMLKDIHIPDSLKFPDSLSSVHTIFIPVHDGAVFHLGSRDVKVITLAGHTPGSICLLDVNNKFLFTGDNNNTVWLFFKESLPVAVYLESLKKLNKLGSQYNIIYSGHGPSTPVDIINELMICCEQILSGKCEAKPYHSMIGTDAVSCSYKTVTIAYDPLKLR